MRGVLYKGNHCIDRPIVEQIFGLHDLGIKRKCLDGEAVAVK